MAQHTVPADEVAIKALRCPKGKVRIVYQVDGHGNDGLELYVESSGTYDFVSGGRIAPGALDMIIAAVAAANDCVVVTDNEKHFAGIRDVQSHADPKVTCRATAAWRRNRRSPESPKFPARGRE